MNFDFFLQKPPVALSQICQMHPYVSIFTYTLLYFLLICLAQVRSIGPQLLNLPLQKPASSSPFPIHWGQILLIVHIIISESLYKPRASDITPRQFAPLSIYLFIPKSLLATLVSRQLIRPIPGKEGFAAGVSSPCSCCRHVGGSFSRPARGLFHPRLLSHFHSSLAPAGPW